VHQVSKFDTNALLYGLQIGQTQRAEDALVGQPLLLTEDVQLV
jgi:hypothetical protein